MNSKPNKDTVSFLAKEEGYKQHPHLSKVLMCSCSWAVARCFCECEAETKVT